MIRQLFIPIFLLSCLITTTASEAPTAKDNCQSRCGKVNITFPFGIGEGCYVDEWFEVVCGNSSTSPRPILKRINLEVIRIDLYDGTLDVRFPITFWNCGGGKTQQESRSLKGSPFAFAEDKNKFIAVGCEGHATISSEIDSDKPIVAGCSSVCANSVSVDTRCNGVNCCRTSIPPNLQVFNARFNITSSSDQNSETDCRYAFLVKETWFSQSVRNLSALSEMTDVPVVLNWGLDASKHGDSVNSTESSPPSRYCNRSSSTSIASLFSPPGHLVCYCKDGFEGNPYLDKGCDDIDECKPGGSKRPCGEYAKCKNNIGSYKCEPNCTNLAVPLGIVAAVAAMLLVPASRESYRLVKNIIDMRRKAEFFIQNGGKLLEQLYSGDQPVLFDSEKLEKATDGFKTEIVLDQEGQGTAYKGMLEDGNIVAVEESEIVDESKVEEFIKEVVNRLKANHKNVVKLFGTCLEKKRPLLVYECVPNGTLHHYIYDKQEEFQLTWEIRLRIATEIAEALSHLHSLDMLSTYHRDITSKNILLDGKYRAKLADIGTSRTVATDDVATDDDTDLTTAVQGTFDLVDTGTSGSIATDDQTDLTTAEHGPSGHADTGTSRSIDKDDQTDLTTAGHGTSGNLDRSGQSTKMSDVYGFGVVLVELLVGKKLVSIQRSKQGTSPVTYFMQSMEEKKLFDIVDARVKKEGKKASITEFAELAKRCLNSNAKKRPAMKKVADELEKIRKSEIKASDAHDEQCFEEVEPETWVGPAVELFSSISS